MAVGSNKLRRVALDVAVVALAVLLIWGTLLAARDFGLGSAAVLSLFVAMPLVVAVRLRRRWQTVLRREFTFFVMLCCAAVGGSGFVVRAWYASGVDRHHAEDVIWAEFKRRLRQEPAFRDIQVHKSNRKHVYWTSGAVNSEADLARLHVLAAECGIEGRRLDGPFADSISLSVRVRSER